MPINKELLKAELERIRYYLQKIENMEMTPQQYAADEDLHDSLAFRILQTVEKCIDVATHIIANESLETVENARSSFEVLARHHIISSELAKKLGNAVGMRNIIVHQYDDIDLNRLYQVYTTDKADLKEFVRSIAEYIETK